MSRRRQNHRTARASATGTDRAATAGGSNAREPIGPWLTFVAAVLMLARYFLPAESAALGETLWIVQFWLMAAVVWFWLTARAGGSVRRLDSFDLGVGLLAAGHVVSAVMVLLSEGDRRGALNMLWEWIGIVVATLMIRAVLQTRAGRARLLRVVVLAAVTLSGLGLWQHHVWYPSLSEKLQEFDRLQSTAPADPQSGVIREQRLAQLQSELGPLLAGGDDAAGALFRARIAASTEPIGRFALANTFAGLLLVGLLLAAGQLLRATAQSWGATAKFPGATGSAGATHAETVTGQRTGEADGGLRLSAVGAVSRWRLGTGALLAIGMAYCFWLTKSRTAVVGLLAGLAVWFLLSRRAGAWSRSVRWAAVVGGLLLIALPVIASLAGGLDREVLTEAPKSLQYRLEYWTATGEVIRQSPWLGVGPGNFRQAYLAHKLPGSSEEVLDPHNLLLDVWANGGVLALAGLLWVVATTARAGWRRTGGEPAASDVATLSAEAEAEAANAPPGSIVADAAIGITALVMAAFVNLMSGSGFLAEFWWLVGGWCAVSWLWPKGCEPAQPAIAAAATALLVHLMGAGGIAMPAILQTLLLLGACLMPQSTRAAAGHQEQAAWSALPPPLPWKPMAGAAACLCLAIACAFTATLPVSASRTQVAVAQSILAEGGRPEQAIRALESAIEADPLSSEAWQQLALAHAGAWQRQARSDEQSFQNAVQAQQEAIRLDPAAATGWQMLGDLWWLYYEARVAAAAAQESLAAYRQAAERYPHLATLQAKLARAAAACSEDRIARQAAANALELEAANRRAGHVDKYLPESLRQQMESIAGAEAVEL